MLKKVFKNYKQLNQTKFIQINIKNKLSNKFQKILKNKKQTILNKSIGLMNMRRKKYQENLKNNKIHQSLIENDIYFFSINFYFY